MTLKFEEGCLRTENVIMINIFRNILKMFKNLIYLSFEPTKSFWHYISFHTAHRKDICSTNLLELHINLKNLHDCCYLLDGRFNNLNQLNVNFLSNEKNIIQKKVN